MKTNLAKLNPIGSLDCNAAEFKRVYITLLIVGFIYAFPILILDRYYIDDLGRSIQGQTFWAQDGRPFTSRIMGLLNLQYSLTEGNIHLIDVSPLFQILSIAVLAFSASVLLVSISSKEKFNFFYIMLVFPVIGSPYLLENLSYKFDSISMTLALSLSIISAISLTKTNRILNIIIGSFLIFVVFGLYQPAANAFIGTTCLIFIAGYLNNRFPNYKLLLDNTTKLFFGSLIYKLYLTGKYFLSGKHFLSDYIREHATLISFNAHGLEQSLSNATKFTKIVYELFAQTPILSCFAILFLLILLIKIFIYSSQYNFLNRFILLLTLILCIFITALSTIGLLLFLSNPVSEPRVFIGFTIFLVLILYSYKIAVGRFWNISKYLIIIPVFYMFFIAYGYAAAVRSQFYYDNYLIPTIIKDLRASGMNDSNFLLLDGVEPRSPVLKNSSKVKILERLVPIYINNDWWWGYALMSHFGLVFNKLDETYADSKKIICSGSPVVSVPEYKIFKYESIYLVSFQGGECFDG